MKRLSLPGLLLGLLALFCSPLVAATTDTTTAKSKDKSPSAAIAGTVSTITGMAISPLLGTGAYGAYQYFSAEKEERPNLPWYAQVSFWLPALGIVGAVAAKDALGAALPPGWKKPLDVLETVENKATGLVAAGAVVPFTMASLSKMIASNTPSPDALAATGTATIHVAAIDWSWLLNILTVPLGIAVFVVVWMASHAINALILLSPWGAIDAALKAGRTALLGLVTVSAALNPWIGLALSVVVIIFAYFIAGWSFRLTIFGAIFSWDFFTGARRRRKPSPEGNKLFSSTQLTKQGVPMRTWGRLAKTADSGAFSFTYKPWLVLPEKTVAVNFAEPAVGKGLFFSTIRDGERTSFVLPPRYRGHEETIAEIYRLGAVEPAGLLKAWGALRELFGGSAPRPRSQADAAASHVPDCAARREPVGKRSRRATFSSTCTPLPASHPCEPSRAPPRAAVSRPTLPQKSVTH